MHEGKSNYQIAREAKCTRAEVNEVLRAFAQKTLRATVQTDQKQTLGDQPPSITQGSGERPPISSVGGQTQPPGQPPSGSGQGSSPGPTADDIAGGMVEKRTSVEVELSPLTQVRQTIIGSIDFIVCKRSSLIQLRL